MKLVSRLENGLQRLLDGFYAAWPQPHPGAERLKQSKIVSHRGEHNNRSVFENTLAAFDKAYDAGVWGIEFDVRWTRDLQPVVIHDPDLNRVFGIDLKIGDVSLEALRRQCPQVPMLAEVILKYGRKLHMMLEIKAEAYPDPLRQNRILQDCFAALEPGADYHLVSLSPEMFELITFVPASTFIPIAVWKPSRFSRIALEKEWGGVAGHYFLLNGSLVARHHARGQKVGTGYPGSKNCLFREINRGIEWIFSNQAGELQKLVNELVETT